MNFTTVRNQTGGRIWPVGHSLPTFVREHCFSNCRSRPISKLEDQFSGSQPAVLGKMKKNGK